jgi:S1-C subfamily serine protease
MRSRIVILVSLAAGAVLAAAATLRADAVADQIRKVREAAAPSTVVVTYYVERDDGARADVHMLGTVVGPKNLVMFSSAAISSQYAVSQFHDFKAIVAKGDDLQTFNAEYLGKDDQAEAAFLRITDPSAPALPALEFDPSAAPAVGDAVVTLSCLGESDGFGRIVQLSRITAQIEQPVMVYLTDVPLGSPGSPVMTLDGKAVGVVGFVRLNRGTNARPNWALSAVVWPAARFMERLKNPPTGGALVKRGWIGVQTLTPVTKDLAEYFKLGARRGVVIGQVLENTPAEKAGLKPEDIVLAIDGKDIRGTEGQLVENFSNELRERKVGETVTLEIWRDGKTQPVKVVLAEQPKSAAEAQRYKNTPVGLTVREMVLADRVSKELPASETGVVVAFLTPAGWAQDGGLQVGDIIKKVQDQDVATLADFRRVFEAEARKKPKEIVLFVLRGSKDTQLVRIETRWDDAAKSKAGPPEKKPAGEGEPNAPPDQPSP